MEIKGERGSQRSRPRACGRGLTGEIEALSVRRKGIRIKKNAHQGKPEELSRRLGDNGVIGTGELPCSRYSPAKNVSVLVPGVTLTF